MWPLSNVDAPLIEGDLSTTSALVIDSNPTSRAILVNQLRDFGVGTVSQCTRVVDARRQLEFKTYDIVLCEHYFGKDSATGQELHLIDPLGFEISDRQLKRAGLDYWPWVALHRHGDLSPRPQRLAQPGHGPDRRTGRRA